MEIVFVTLLVVLFLGATIYFNVVKGRYSKSPQKYADPNMSWIVGGDSAVDVSHHESGSHASSHHGSVDSGHAGGFDGGGSGHH